MEISRSAICTRSWPSSLLTLSPGTVWTPSTRSTIACSSRTTRPSSAFRCTTLDADNTEAAKKAIELLSAKEIVDKQKYFGLYLQQLQTQVKFLKALNEPVIGDGLVKSDTDSSFWMQALVAKGDKLDVKNIKQQAAMPLSSFLRFDPWTDKLMTLHPAFEPILNARDKMPFEVTPIYLKLQYYKAPADAPPAPAAPAAAPADQTAPAAAPTAAPTQP